jgi:predicted dehydrogenase
MGTKRIRVAIIGQGRSGRDIHGRCLLQDTRRFRIVAVAEPLADRRERAMREYGCEALADSKPLLRRKDLDLIINASPSKFHVPITLEFLKAGFNVLCEKPLASTARDVDRLIAAARRSRKVFAIFQQSRFAPYFQQVRKVIASGALGDVVQISIAFNGFSRRYDWQTLTEEMGGNLLNTGPHPLDQALQLFGAEAMPKVACFMRNAISCGDAEDHVLLILSGEGRPLIHLEISSCCAYPPFTYHVYGTRGGLKGAMNEMQWKYYDVKSAPKLKLIRTPIANPDGTPAYCSDSLRWIEKTWAIPEAQRNMFLHMSRAFYRMLYRTLSTGAPLQITPEHVRKQIAVIEECHRQNPAIYKKRR